MKKYSAVLMILLTAYLFSGTVRLSEFDSTGFRVTSDNEQGFSIHISLDEITYSLIETETGSFTGLSFKGSKNTYDTGKPQIPVFRELIAFPEGSEPEVRIISFKEKELFLSDLGIKNIIIPAQPSWSKSSKPEERKFVINSESYKTDSYSKEEIASISRSGVMRGIGVGVLEIRPVTYNPVRNSVRVMTDIEAEVIFNGVKSDPSAARAEHFSPYFEGAFSKLINKVSTEAKSDLIRYPVTYLIAANQILDGNTKLQEFIDWKTEKGFKVITQFFPSTATVTDVDTWIENKYQDLTPKPSFVLIIGDQSGTYVIPTEQNPALGSAGSVTVSDLVYGVIGATGSTNRIPSIHVGRFSVNNLSELDAQVDKTIWYEKNQFTSGADLSYLSNVMGVAGVDASYATSHGNPQISYGMSYYFNTNYRIPLDGTKANITGIAYYYPESASSAVDPAVIAHVSSGVAFYNYTAHGYEGGFGDPSFTISNVDNLTNTGKYPLVVGNCCLTGSFRNTECFGEAWLNAPNKGGIGFIGASMSTYWDEDLAMGVGLAASNQVPPPLDTNNPGMYDGNMRMNFPSQAGIKFIGLLAVENLGTNMTSSYWSSYHLFGDPSLMPYMGVPGDNTVSHSPVMVPGETFFTVQALKGSYVAITDDAGDLHGAAVADEFGYAAVPVEPFVTGNAHIVVTSQFKKPYFATVPVEALTGPYLIVNNHNLSSTKFASSGSIDMELKNIGVLTSQGISVTVSSMSEYINFTDYQELFSDIAAGDSLKKDLVFSYTIAPDVPDKEEIRIDITVNDTSKRTYYSYIIFNSSAPVLKFEDSHEGDIYPGDSKEITITVSNEGSSALSNVTAVLSETTGGEVTISGPQSVDVIPGSGSVQLIFNVDFSASIKNGTGLKFDLSLSNGSGYNESYLFNLNVGMTENFETGDFTANEWYFEGNTGWLIDNVYFYAGNYSSRSGNITHNQTSSMKIDFEFLEDGIISFYKKVSSESGYDKLTFYIDGASKGSWSGEQNWGYVSYPVIAGVHTLKWTYNKDVSDTYGLDRAWVDNILATNILMGIETDSNLIPDNLTLSQNYPNPFNPVTTIRFSLPSMNSVKLNIYNPNGQLIKTMFDRKLNKGTYEVTVDAANLNSGVYFYTLETDSEKLTRKMLLIK